jgi:anti-anti-sigma factor
MSEPPARKVDCPVVVLSLNEPQINNDVVAEALRDEMLSLYTGVGAVHAVIDFHKVQYLSSAGFRPLLSLNRQVRERGGRLVLCNMQPQVQEVFAVTRLIDPDGKTRTAFHGEPTTPDAVAYLYHAEPSA